MKLLYCELCESVFSLSEKVKSCECGAVKGRYVNSIEAEVNGKGYSLAIGNGSLWLALGEISEMRQDPRQESPERDPWSRHLGSMIAWARPHTGPANPHTKINLKLGEK